MDPTGPARGLLGVVGLVLVALSVWAFSEDTTPSASRPRRPPGPVTTHVIGVTHGDEAKAYPVSFLNGRELVVDEIDKISILVSW